MPRWASGLHGQSCTTAMPLASVSVRGRLTSCTLHYCECTVALLTFFYIFIFYFFTFISKYSDGEPRKIINCAPPFSFLSVNNLSISIHWFEGKTPKNIFVFIFSSEVLLSLCLFTHCTHMNLSIWLFLQVPNFMPFTSVLKSPEKNPKN